MIEDHTIEVAKSTEDRNSEKDLIRKINKDFFYKIMIDFDVDLKLIFEENRVNLKQAQGFNRMLTHMHNSRILELSECLIFVEQDFAPFKKILSVLNEENMQIVKTEMARKFNIKMKKNALENFIYE